MEGNNKKWRLGSLSIRFVEGYEYSNTVDRYTGTIEFEDEEKLNSFEFELNPELCSKYLDVVKQDVIDSARELGEKIALSLEGSVGDKD